VVGYQARYERLVFVANSYSLPPAPGEDDRIRLFCALCADDRLKALQARAQAPPWLLGVGAWDSACFRRGQRYTIGIVAAPEQDLSVLEPDSPLDRMPIGACGWLYFLPRQEQHQHFRQDNPFCNERRIVPAA